MGIPPCGFVVLLCCLVTAFEIPVVFVAAKSRFWKCCKLEHEQETREKVQKVKLLRSHCNSHRSGQMQPLCPSHSVDHVECHAGKAGSFLRLEIPDAYDTGVTAEVQLFVAHHPLSTTRLGS